MLADYEEKASDPELLSLRHQIAVVDARIRDVLRRVDTGEAGANWQAARKAVKAFQTAARAQDSDQMDRAFGEIAAAVRAGAGDAAAWAEVMSLFDQQRRLVESENKRVSQLQIMITSERALLMFGAMGHEFRQCILNHCDDELAERMIEDMRARLEKLRNRFYSPTMIEG